MCCFLSAAPGTGLSRKWARLLLPPTGHGMGLFSRVGKPRFLFLFFIVLLLMVIMLLLLVMLCDLAFGDVGGGFVVVGWRYCCCCRYCSCYFWRCCCCCLRCRCRCRFLLSPLLLSLPPLQNRRRLFRTKITSVTLSGSTPGLVVLGITLHT